jgi:hypothetical protein
VFASIFEESDERGNHISAKLMGINDAEFELEPDEGS